MNTKKIVASMTLSVFLSFVVSGCGDTVEEIVKDKQVIQIQTQLIHTDDNTGYISKSAKVQGESEITVTSQTAGMIDSIQHRIGDQVAQGTLLMGLQDTAGMVSFGAQKSEIAKEIAQNNYTIQQQSLAKQVQDAQLALERAKITEQATRDDIAKQEQKVAYDLTNTNALVTGSITQIQLAKLEADLEKAEFDYQSKLKADAQTNENLITSARNIQSDLQLILTDTLTETDKLLGITDVYINDTNYRDMRVYISAKSISTKNAAVDNFWVIKGLETDLKNLVSSNISASNVNDYLKKYQSIIVGLSDHFVLMKQVFTDTIEDLRYATQIATSQGLFSALQAKSSALNASVTNQLNTIRSYFVSYADNQESLARQIDSLRSQIALTKRSLDDTSFNTVIGADRTQIGLDSQLKTTELSTKGTKSTLDFTVNTKNNTLRIAESNLKNAQVALQEALFNKSKLSIEAPIPGSIADILVDIGQEVSPGTPLLKIVSPQQQIETTLTADEVENLSLGQKVIIESEIGSAQGVLTSIARVADKSSSFKVVIVLSDSSIPTGLFVQIKIPVQEGTLILPINSLKIVDTNIAIANFRDTKTETVVSKKVSIDTIFGDQVEIVDFIGINYELITTNLDNYDENTMQIVKKTETQQD